MPILSRAVLLSLLLLLAGCSGGADSPDAADSQDDSASATSFDDLNTPPPVAQADQDAEPDGAPPALPAPSATDNAEPMPQASSADGTDASSADTGSADSDTDDPGIAIVPDEPEPLPPRESLAGRWEFLIGSWGADFLMMLIEIEQEGETFAASIADDTQVIPGLKVVSAEISERTAAIEFTAGEDMAISFRGRLEEDGVVRGNVLLGEESLELVRWLPTERESLQGADLQVPSENVDAMLGYEPDPDDPFPGLREKVTELGESAMACELCRRIAGAYRGARPDADEFAGFPEQYLATAEPWGERVIDKTQLDIAYTMAVCGYDPQDAAEHLSGVEEKLADSPVETFRRRVAIARGLIDLQIGDEQQKQEAMETLKAIRQDDPFDTDVILSLASFYERDEQPEQALPLYSVLAALPTGAGDMEPVTRLWEELGREPEELEAYLNEVYKEHVHLFAEPASDAPRADGPQQTILGELFTGAGCRPCVAADIATGGLEVTYPQSDFIMLRYHEHVPLPDQLTVPAGEERAGGYYRIAGTPSLYFNGQPIQVQSMIGPTIIGAPEGYAELRQIVDQLLGQSSDLEIALQAAADGEVVNISAEVTGVEEFPESWRLRLCLAEDEVVFPAPNGVRLHEMLVRAMPGGAEGIGPEDDKLTFTGSLSLEDLRQEITDYVSEVKSQIPIESFPPPPMDFAHLHVVAFVQNDSNRQVLQAASVPVTGLTAGGSETAPETAEPGGESPPADETAEDTPSDDESGESEPNESGQESSEAPAEESAEQD